MAQRTVLELSNMLQEDIRIRPLRLLGIDVHLRLQERLKRAQPYRHLGRTPPLHMAARP